MIRLLFDICPCEYILVISGSEQALCFCHMVIKTEYELLLFNCIQFWHF